MEIHEAITMAMAEFMKEYGKDAKLEEGDEFVTVFNDGVLIVGVEDHTMKIKFSLGKPYIIDRSLNMTQSAG